MLKSAKNRLLLICVILFSPVLHPQTVGWVQLPSGLEIYRASSPTSETPRLTALRVDLRKFNVLTVSPAQQLGGAQESHSYSLQDLAMHDAAALAVSNGGATANFNIPIPDGLLRTNGVELSPFNDHHPKGGVFCVSRNNRAEIVEQGDPKAVNPHSFDRCRSAIQAGPMLIQDKKSLVRSRAGRESWERTAVAIDSTGRLLLIVSDAVTLDGFADRLLRLNAELQVDVALNLDGGSSSGLMYKAGGGDYVRVGYTKGLVGSAIIVHKATVRAVPER